MYGISYVIGAIDGSHILDLAPVVGGEKFIIVGNHSTQQFYKELLNQIVCFGIMNSDGQEVYTIGPYSKWKKLDGHV